MRKWRLHALLALNKSGDQSGDAIVGQCIDGQGKMHTVTRDELHKFVESYADLTLAEQLGSYTKNMPVSDRAGLVKATQDAMLLAPDAPARQAQVIKLADVYLNSFANDDDKTVAAIGPLLLGRSQANGSIPDILGRSSRSRLGRKDHHRCCDQRCVRISKEQSRTAVSADTRMAAGDIPVFAATRLTSPNTVLSARMFCSTKTPLLIRKCLPYSIPMECGWARLSIC